MKNQFIFSNLVWLVLSGATVNPIFGQTGKIAGKVTDKTSGEALIGLTVKVKDAAAGVSTDVDGHYVLALNPGEYTLNFSYLGYQTKRITGIVVKAGTVTNLDVLMDEDSGQHLKEVVVTASARQESVNGLYARQKNSIRISDGISSEQIRRSPDRNTGEALKRVSGTTIQENKFVIVRGLSDRYNTAMLDNSPLPSTEPNRKAFSFDIVPSNLVDNIIVSKTATPDLPADFAGGVVQITTNAIPDQDFITAGAGWGYNGQSTFKDFSYGNRYTSDYLGFDDGKRKLKPGFPASRSQLVNLTPQENLAAIKALPSDWNLAGTSALPAQTYQLTVGRVHNTANNGRLGGIVSLIYRNSQNVIGDQQRDFSDFNYDDQVNVFSTSLGALANFGYTFGKNKISLKNIYNHIFDDKYTFRTGTNTASGSDVNYYAFDLLQKGLFKSTLEGDHSIGENNNRLNWNIAYSNVINDQPDQRKISYLRPMGTNEPFAASNTSTGKENNRLFSSLSENTYSADVNYSMPGNMFGRNSNIKVGLGSKYTQRDFSARFLGLNLLTSASNYSEIRNLPVTELYSEDLVDQGVYMLDEITTPSDKYDANSLTNFVYAMADNKIGEKVRIVWGVRGEAYKLRLNSAWPTNEPLHLKQDYFDILPSVNFTYSIDLKSNFRLSYYRTLARPEFRELAPFAYYDYEQLGTVSGSPDLKRSLIDNADLRYEIYPAAGQIISFSIFYKHFTNAIEPNIYDANSTSDFSYFNSDDANNYGAELEIRRSLDFLNASEAFKNTIAYANISVIRSKVKNPTDFDYLEKERPMVGQSPYVINAGIQHSAFNNRLNVNILYNRVGRRIFRAGGVRFTSIWENPRDVLDFTAGYKVLKNKGEVKLNLSDLLNNDYLFYFDNTKDKKYDASSNDQTFLKYKTGTNASLSFSYTF